MNALVLFRQAGPIGVSRLMAHGEGATMIQECVVRDEFEGLPSALHKCLSCAKQESGWA